MPFIFKEYHKEKLIVKKIRGNISILEIQDILIKTIQLNDRFPEHRILNDFRFSTLNFNTKELTVLLKGISTKEIPKHSKVFIFDTDEDSSLYDLFVNTYNLKNTYLFDSLEKACAFYGIDKMIISGFLEN
ncbi:MAG: hypothetical protein COB98_10760 [Flavobacteriaceae bacterium]|nr:MAG: hypothetical protein COB98_10760 [Flavobacteriaceae bacterium]